MKFIIENKKQIKDTVFYKLKTESKRSYNFYVTYANKDSDIFTLTRNIWDLKSPSQAKNFLHKDSRIGLTETQAKKRFAAMVENAKFVF